MSDHHEIRYWITEKGIEALKQSEEESWPRGQLQVQWLQERSDRRDLYSPFYDDND